MEGVAGYGYSSVYAEPPLPYGWQKRSDESGKTYYENLSLQRTQWTHPAYDQHYSQGESSTSAGQNQGYYTADHSRDLIQAKNQGNQSYSLENYSQTLLNAPFPIDEASDDGRMHWSHSLGKQDEFNDPYTNRAIGDFADCGQYAKNDSVYTTGSIDPVSFEEQLPAINYPGLMEPKHGRTAVLFRDLPIPHNANVIAYYNIANEQFHFAKIHRDGDGSVAYFSHNDALFGDGPIPGGTMSVYNQSMAMVAKRGIQPAKRLDHLSNFVDYCERMYGSGLYFFAK